jgi:hypothetical protein
MLEDAIGDLLGNSELRKQFYDHPLIKGLHTNHGKRKPGGIPNDKFALVLSEMVMNAGGKTVNIQSSFEDLKKSVEELKAREGLEQLAGSLEGLLNNAELRSELESTYPSLKKGVENLKGQKGFEQIGGSLSTLLIGIEERVDKTKDAAAEARQRMESWFNDSMDRLSGAYRRRVQIITLIVGVALAAILNVDSLAIIDKLWREPIVREALVQQAEQQIEVTTDEQEITVLVDQLNALPLGWALVNIPDTTGAWATKVLGILLTGVAAAQGAPYWFDLMKKLLRPAPAK